MLTVRRAVQAEFDVIMGIYRIAQDFMIRTGNPNQWKHGFKFGKRGYRADLLRL